MSWFSGLAGRAESFLNQMDEAAATSLQEVGIGTPSPNKPSVTNKDDIPTTTGLSYEPIAQSVSKPLSQTAPQSKFTKSFMKQTDHESDVMSQRSRPHSGTSTSLDSDTLMSFLNSPTTKPKSTELRQAKTTPTRPRSSQGREKRVANNQWKMASGKKIIHSIVCHYHHYRVIMGQC